MKFELLKKNKKQKTKQNWIGSKSTSFASRGASSTAKLTASKVSRSQREILCVREREREREKERENLGESVKP